MTPTAAVLYNPAQLRLVQCLCLAHVLIPSKPKLLCALSIKSEVLVGRPEMAPNGPSMNSMS
jgi:hypothetical protein